jgi:hypothetical protein
MTLGDVSAIVFTVLAALLAMPSIALAFRAITPRLASRAELRVGKRPVLTFFIGLVATGLALGLVVALGAGPAPAKFLSAVFGFTFGLAALAGIGGLAAHIGTMLPSPHDGGRAWRGTLRGAIILDCAFLFPVIGWLLVYPVAIVLGMGAAVMSLFPVAEPRPAYAPAMPVPTASIPNAFVPAGPEEVVHR